MGVQLERGLLRHHLARALRVVGRAVEPLAARDALLHREQRALALLDLLDLRSETVLLLMRIVTPSG